MINDDGLNQVVPGRKNWWFSVRHQVITETGADQEPIDSFIADSALTMAGNVC